MNALRAALVLAYGTLLQAIRSRLLWVSVIFVGVLVALSVAGASVAIFQRARLIVDVGLAACSAVGTVVALGTTIVFFSGELQTRTAYPVLARPLPRWSFVLGKFLGLLFAMWGVVACMGLSTAAVVYLFAQSVPEAFWLALGLCGVEMAVVVALSLLFASLAAPALAASYAAAVLLAGHLSHDIVELANKVSPAAATTLRGAYFVLPDLAKLSLRSQAANDLAVPGAHMAQASAYGALYAALALGLAMVIFSRRAAL